MENAFEHPRKYPSTGHWRWSQTVHRDDSYHPDPEFFVGKEVVITEKLDGGNTCLYQGEVYARSTLGPSRDGWMAMVRKHHAWKTVEYPLTGFYGEDLYGIHSIIYDALHADQTYRLFAVRDMTTGTFESWDMVEFWAKVVGFLTVPVVFRGTFDSTDAITDFFQTTIQKGSVLGPTCEGFVMRTVVSIPEDDFRMNVAKYVRANHVQTDQHWKVNWQPAEVIHAV